MYFSAQVSEAGRWNMSKPACKRYGLGIIFMLGGVVAAYVKALQLRVGKQEKSLAITSSMSLSATHRRNI
jgi:hypothetical protein